MHLLVRKFYVVCSLVLFVCSAAPQILSADETPKSGADTNSANASKPPAGAELTERERWLLDRVEKLEQRVAELEGKRYPAEPTASIPAIPPAANASPQPANVAAVPATALSVQPNVSPASAPVATKLAKGEKPAKAEPFAFADFTWLNGNARTKDLAFDTKFFTPEIRVDADYIYDFHHPKDDTIGGSSEVFRSNELHLTQLGVGGDFHFDNVRARLMTQFGLYSQTTPRNDASPSRGQWNLDNAYRYISEAYGGYHFNALHGINVDAGIFMSYVGLFSYYNFDNWAYQPSYVSSNTPWFFNGVRVEVFPTDKLKIEGWFINGWQSYGRFNNRPGLGGQILWRPNGNWSIVSNEYGYGEDALGIPTRTRLHTDNSVQYKYYQGTKSILSMAAATVTFDAGCESGGGV